MKITYETLQDDIRAAHGRVMQTCWIADRREKNGLPVNWRRIGPRKKPCPPRYADVIDNAMRARGLL
jgi:hypothetical protein